ncbi:MAG: hypothetical protein RL320_1826, partial [Pseudomonadota bacterium]
HEPDLAQVGAALARDCAESRPRLMTLSGSLGTGKTTLVRSLLRALGVEGRIKSPSFSVMEVYDTSIGPVHHCDFYRLKSPSDWRDLGLRDLLDGEQLLIVEWPEMAEGLPQADLSLALDFTRAEDATGPRSLTLTAQKPLPHTRALLPLLEASVQTQMNAQRRDLVLGAGAALLLGFQTQDVMALEVLAVRLWPARDYTRVAIEHDSPGLAFRTNLLTQPDRLLVDIEGMQLSPALKELVARIAPNDPYIAGVRVGQFQPTVVRLVFDLKQPVKPQVFMLSPVAQYAHRLVLDFYPQQEIDPLLSFLASVDQGPAQPEGVTPQAPAPSPPPPKPAERDPIAAFADPPGQVSTQRLVTIALDPGHGGEDPGAVGKSGAREKDIVLAIARRVKRLIDQQSGVKAFLTRDGDYFVPLGRRVQKARAVRADLFVSIHADAWISPHAKGSSVYVLSERGASSAAARWMAKQENRSDEIGGLSIESKDRLLTQTLLDMSTTAQIKDSLKLAKSVLSEIGEINTLHKRQVEQAGFAVLKAPDIPSILIETAFISNPDEERRLKDDGYQNQIAQAIVDGLLAYLENNPPLARRAKRS